MLKSLVSIFKPEADDSRPVSSDYEPVSIGDEAQETSLVRVEDRGGKGVYFCFWVLGAGVLLSWNALICTMPLLASYFPEDSPTKASLASWLSTAFCLGNLFFLGSAQRSVGKSSPSPRLHHSLILLFLSSLFITFPTLPILLPILPASLMLPFLLFLTVVLSLATAWLQCAVFALAALWGSQEMLAVMSGQGGIAILVSLVQVGLAVISALHGAASGDEDYSDSQSTLAGIGLWALGSAGAFGCMIAHRWLMRHPDYRIVLAPLTMRGAGLMTGEDGEEQALGKQHGEGATRRLLRKNAALNLAVAYVFVVTLAVFPPVTASITSVQDPPPRLLRPDVFIPLHFLIFNIGDYVGRTYLPAIPALIFTSQPIVLVLSLSRTLFIPLLLICNTPNTNSPIINSDTLFFLIILFFGITNGYIGSLAMILAPSPALNPRVAEEEKDVAGSLAAFCLVAGLAVGSLCSFGVGALVH
ncbi:nucleoside transporter-domain-containing protein [Naematelia encephala]|uniref:Nucleoside transporter-domain-containing protein n=1 Tax=Naematelia encephala TaxID=71784 RepID=A0A1Y2AT78_9TREE|nr:nucleoside transporter-domain-containing protein [Naematelia encephala]